MNVAEHSALLITGFGILTAIVFRLLKFLGESCASQGATTRLAKAFNLRISDLKLHLSLTTDL